MQTQTYLIQVTPSNQINRIPYDNSYKCLKDAVGGYIEVLKDIPYNDKKKLAVWCDEEYLLKHTDSLEEQLKNFNIVGSAIYNVQPVFGNIVYSFVNAEGETLGLTEKEADVICEHIADIFADLKIVRKYSKNRD